MSLIGAAHFRNLQPSCSGGLVIGDSVGGVSINGCSVTTEAQPSSIITTSVIRELIMGLFATSTCTGGATQPETHPHRPVEPQQKEAQPLVRQR